MEQSMRLRISIFSLTSFTFGWLFLGWLSWVFQGCKAIMPFISDIDLYQPGDTIFTFGAIGSSFLVTWFLFEIQYYRHKYLVKNEFSNFWIVFNYVSIVPGIVAAVSCFRIAYTPWDVDGIAHGAFANDIFYGGVIWCVLVTTLTIKLFYGSEKFIKLISIRIITSVLAIVSLWQMISNAVLVWNNDFKWEEWSSFAQDKQDFCTNSVYPLLDIAALWEWALIGAILATIMTFIPEIKLLKISEEE
tara:strand:+ start:812 stop:1549 length:738 start_codon:yes stop_codon:yes gene_type:complete